MKKLRQRHEEGDCEHTPIRGSMAILIAKLLTTLFIFELLFGAVYYLLFLILGIPISSGPHHHVALAILVIETFKIVFQGFLVLRIALSWATYSYFIDGTRRHLVKRSGIIYTREDIFEFNTVRSISVYQSWLGRLLRYGDVTLKTSASGGYQAILTIAGIHDPKKYEKMIKECL